MSVTATVYFASAGAVAVTPAFESWWTRTADAQRLPLVLGSPSGTPFATITSAGTVMPPWAGSTVYARVLLAQFISDPLPADSGIPTQIDKWLMRAFGSISGGSAAKQHCAFAYKYVSENGAISRGAHRYLNTYPGTNPHEWTGAIAVYNLAASSVNVSSLWNALPGDRLVIEVGYSVRQINSTAITGYSGTIEVGGDASDLVEGENEQKNPWDRIRIPAFSVTATFDSEATFHRPQVAPCRPEIYGAPATPASPFLNEAFLQ